MKKILIIIIVIFVIQIVVSYFVYNAGVNSVVTTNTIDTVFLDTAHYNKAESVIRVKQFYINNIKKERNEKLKSIDTISNDSAVSLFYRLLSE